MKKKMMVILFSFICTCSLAFAYLTSQDEVKNQFTIGENVSEIVEEFPNNQFEDGSLKKEVRVLNKGNVDCYVRVFVGLSNEDYNQQLTFDFNEQDWKKIGDYYYYQSVLPVNALTTPLFTEVHSSQEVEDDLEIIVYEETVDSTISSNIEEAFSSIGGIL